MNPENGAKKWSGIKAQKTPSTLKKEMAYKVGNRWLEKLFNGLTLKNIIICSCKSPERRMYGFKYSRN